MGVGAGEGEGLKTQPGSWAVVEASVSGPGSSALALSDGESLPGLLPGALMFFLLLY